LPSMADVRGPPRPDCARTELENELRLCAFAARTEKDRQACKKAADSKSSDCGLRTPSAEETKAVTVKAGNEAMSQCLFGARTDEARRACKAMYVELTGETLNEGTAQKVAAEDGARAALASEMETCMLGAADNAAKAACKAAAKGKLENLKGESLSDSEIDATLRDAGMDRAGGVIRECVETAQDQAARDACLTSSDAKEAAALAMGKDKNDITDADLREAADREATTKTREAMEVCTKLATTEAEKKACRMSDDLKEAIALSKGLDLATIEESLVREVLKKGTEDRALTAIKSCGKGDSAARAQCETDAKKLIAEASGRDPNEVTDFELKKSSRDALARDLATRMASCMKDAADSAARAACKTTLAKEAIKNADVNGRTPSDADVTRFLDESAKAAAREARETCSGTQQECDDLVKELVAAAKGMRKEDVRSLDVKATQERAAVDVVKEKALACARAKEDDPSATCEDAYTSYNNARGKAPPTNAKKLATDKKRVAREAAASVKAGAMRVCFAKDTKAEVDACLAEADTETDDVVGELFKDIGSQEAKQKKRERVEHGAKTKVLGELYSACYQEAQNATARAMCKDDLAKRKGNAGVAEDDKAVLSRYFADILADPAAACEAAELKQCRAEAKLRAIESGMKPGQHQVVKGLGEVKAAGKIWADCMETGEDESTCDNQAKEEYLAVSGADEASFSDEIMEKVRRLGKALKDGVLTVIQKKRAFMVGVYTDEASCVDATREKIKAALELIVENETNSTAGLGPVASKGCRVVDGEPEYSAVVAANKTDDEIEAASDDVAAEMVDRSLDVRRLEAHWRRLLTSEDALAAQAVEECANDDSACMTEDADLSSTTPGQGTNGRSTTSGAPRRCTVLAAAALLRLVVAF